MSKIIFEHRALYVHPEYLSNIQALLQSVFFLTVIEFNITYSMHLAEFVQGKSYTLRVKRLFISEIFNFMQETS